LKKRNTKEAWLKEGLRVLAKMGEAGLNIDVLAKRLGVTKGSFYHHFKNRQVFSEELLAFWEDAMTEDVTRLSREGDYSERNKRFMELSFELENFDLEVAVRAWALRDPVARSYLARVDVRRIEYLQELAELVTDNKEKAKTVAQLRYALFVGATQMVPTVKGEELKRLREALDKLLFID